MRAFVIIFWASLTVISARTLHGGWCVFWTVLCAWTTVNAIRHTWRKP